MGKTNEKATNQVEGSFSTAAEKNDAFPVNFMVTTCHEYNDQDAPGEGGFKIMKAMEKLKPQFLVHTGDVLYHDHKAKNLALARWNWQRMSSLPCYVQFYKHTPCYFMKDDHDTWMNDCHPASTNKFMGDFTYQQGVQLFRQQVPSSDKPYRSFRWGKDLEIWLFDVREFRKPNEMPDGPDKTIWGKEQLEWFKQGYAASDASFKILISPTPIIGPDRPQKKDNHSNANFSFEGNLIRNLIGGNKNTFVICGDRHWQYVSKHAKTGTHEFACGPASNEHAGGWKKDEKYPEHEYLNIVGGFLRVETNRIDGKPTIVFSHHGVDGNLLFQKQFS
jgi:alkaline phosphatase D